ncbi:EpsG family protein [Bacteroides sp.]|uniref:EpsG family protein n=1 Tax=Bacteroides sp. TaxID=29523 RepID=UPI0026136FB5|nr:EpsG family protein [Bacteroides sp.]MDD3038173.1 EpsG family protein [Bacteroides sp.]
MVFYISVYLICLILSVVADKKDSKPLKFLICVIFVIITGFRGSQVGIDTENYINIWDNLYYGRATFVEPGFTLMNLALQKFTDNPVAIFVTSSSIIYFLIINRLWDFKRIASFPVMISVLYMSHLMMSMNVLRQYCAVAIIFYFTRYLSKGDYIRFIIGILIASTLHLSSLIGFLMFAFEILKWKNLNRAQKLLLGIGIAMSPFILYVASRFAFNQFGGYFSNSESNIGFLTSGKMLFICYACFSFNLFKKKKDFRIDNLSLDVFIRNTILTVILGLCLVSIGYFFPFMERIGLLFSLYEILFWGILFKLISNQNKVLCFLVFSFLVIYPFISSIINNGQGTVPYSFCL